MKPLYGAKKRLDLTVAPSPDLALEIDVTARTYPEIYAALGLPELWRRSGDRCQIYRLQEGRYVDVKESRTPSPHHSITMTKGIEQDLRDRLSPAGFTDPLATADFAGL